MYEFKYKTGNTLEDAKALFNSADDGKYLAGGMTLLPTMKQRLAAPDMLIDLSAVSALSGIEKHNNNIVIGAMMTHAEVATSAMVLKHIPVLANLAACIGDPQVRNRGTLGGSLANCDPASDYPAAVLGLNATINTDKRAIPADEFFVDIFETDLDEDEIITSVSFPIPGSAAYEKFPNPASGYAVVGVFVARAVANSLGADVDQVRVAVTGAGGVVFRVEPMEIALRDNFSATSLSEIVIDADDLNEDIHASAKYRAHLVSVMARRAVEKI